MYMKARTLQPKDRRTDHVQLVIKLMSMHSRFAASSRDLRCYSTTAVRALNRVLFDASECSGSFNELICRLDGRDARYSHMKNILNIQKGDPVKVGVINEGISDNGRVLDMSSERHGSMLVHIGALRSTPRPRVSLILTVPRPQRLKKLIPVLGNLGLHKLVLTGAKNVPNDYFGSHLLKSESLFREALTEGLSQSANDASLPDVYIRRNIWSFITKEIDEIFPENFARTVSHPAKSDSAHGASKSLLSLREVPQSCHNELVIAIGGERGWHEGELELLQKNRFEIVNIGPRIYRSDTAVCIAVALGHEVTSCWMSVGR